MWRMCHILLECAPRKWPSPRLFLKVIKNLRPLLLRGELNSELAGSDEHTNVSQVPVKIDVTFCMDHYFIDVIHLMRM